MDGSSPPCMHTSSSTCVSHYSPSSLPLKRQLSVPPGGEHLDADRDFAFSDRQAFALQLPLKRHRPLIGGRGFSLPLTALLCGFCCTHKTSPLLKKKGRKGQKLSISETLSGRTPSTSSLRRHALADFLPLCFLHAGMGGAFHAYHSISLKNFSSPLNFSRRACLHLRQGLCLRGVYSSMHTSPPFCTCRQGRDSMGYVKAVAGGSSACL